KLGAAYGTGGGGFSGRMTAPLCAAGGIALQLLAQRGVAVAAEILSIGGETDKTRFDAVRSAAASEGDSVGGVIECTVTG
ncbi:chorismate synthase, partial [Pseudomonas aeruginosa]